MTIIVEEDITVNLEREIITAMIISSKFLKNMAPIFKDGVKGFSTQHTQTIAAWCWEYYQKYKRSPKREIKSLFKVKQKTEEEAEVIKSFLDNISEEYVKGRKFNIAYITDLAENYFRKSSLKNLKNQIQKCLTEDDTDKAEKLVNKYTSQIAVREVKWINPFSLKNIRKIFNSKEGEELLTLPGHLGKVTGKFCREYLVAFLGKSGTGKTWNMLECAILGASQGNNVLYINLEMSEAQFGLRLYQRITGRPIEKFNRILIPTFDCRLNQTNECNKKTRVCRKGIVHDENKEISFDITDQDYIPCQICRKYKEKTDYQVATWFKQKHCEEIDVSRVCKRVKNIFNYNHFNGGNLKLATYPAGSTSLNVVEAEIDKMVCVEGFLPDIIITDYADKFVSDTKIDQYRHSLQQIWTKHKALAQKYHALVMTASQSSAMRKDEDTREFDWAEGICKINEIDIGMIQNQTPQEKREGIMRFIVGKHRHRYFNTKNETIVLCNHEIGRPYLDSHLVY